MDAQIKQRYIDAYWHYYRTNYPEAAKANAGSKVAIPNVNTANGLTSFITKFLFHMGHRATRINVMGRKLGNKFIRSTTRKGTADISATINGRSVMLEIKVGKDKPRPKQLKEQELERKAGGVFEFVGTPEQFFEIYDLLTKTK